MSVGCVVMMGYILVINHLNTQLVLSIMSGNSNYMISSNSNGYIFVVGISSLLFGKLIVGEYYIMLLAVVILLITIVHMLDSSSNVLGVNYMPGSDNKLILGYINVMISETLLFCSMFWILIACTSNTYNNNLSNSNLIGVAVLNTVVLINMGLHNETSHTAVLLLLCGIFIVSFILEVYGIYLITGNIYIMMLVIVSIHLSHIIIGSTFTILNQGI